MPYYDPTDIQIVAIGDLDWIRSRLNELDQVARWIQAREPARIRRLNPQ